MMLLIEGAQPPWANVLVRLASFDRAADLAVTEASLGQKAFATLLKPLVAVNRFETGAKVLALKDGQGWWQAVIEQETESGFDVLLGGFQKQEGLARAAVLVRFSHQFLHVMSPFINLFIDSRVPAGAWAEWVWCSSPCGRRNGRACARGPPPEPGRLDL